MAEAAYGIVLVTTPSKAEAEAIASVLLQEYLAACINIHPIHSLYRWEGKINSDSEYQMVIKTDLRLFPSLEAKIKSLHSHSVPEIIALPLVAGSSEYLNWIGDQVKVK